MGRLTVFALLVAAPLLALGAQPASACWGWGARSAMAIPPIVPPTDTLMPVGAGVAGVGGGDGDGGRRATNSLVLALSLSPRAGGPPISVL
jgi:hypothetical protein